jgi:hypothetical protein
MPYLSSDEKQNLGLHFVVLESTSSIFWGAGVLPAQHRASDISQKATRLKLEPQFSIHIAYDPPFGINAGGVVVRAALQYA